MFWSVHACVLFICVVESFFFSDPDKILGLCDLNFDPHLLPKGACRLTEVKPTITSGTMWETLLHSLSHPYTQTHTHTFSPLHGHN